MSRKYRNDLDVYTSSDGRRHAHSWKWLRPDDELESNHVYLNITISSLKRLNRLDPDDVTYFESSRGVLITSVQFRGDKRHEQV